MSMGVRNDVPSEEIIERLLLVEEDRLNKAMKCISGDNFLDKDKQIEIIRKIVALNKKKTTFLTLEEVNTYMENGYKVLKEI